MRKTVKAELRPATDNHTVAARRTPRRVPNSEMRSREHLLPNEVDALLDAARQNRNPNRDWLMVDMCFRHGLRVSELIDLHWDQIDFNGAAILVKRLKGSKPATHPLMGDTLRALRRLRADNRHAAFVFMSERNAPFSRSGFAMLIARLGQKAGLPFKIHPHMLRHACGYALANKGKDTRSIQGYLGHANIQNTVRYTELAPNRFKNIWDD